MKTRRLFIMITALIVCGTMWAQGQTTDTQRKERKRPTKEQMQNMRCARLAEELTLSDDAREKFVATYKDYLNERSKINQSQRGDFNNKKKEVKTDAEVEKMIKSRFATSRQILDLREKYYDKFRKFLTPKQIQKMYDFEGRDNDNMRKAMMKRKGNKALRKQRPSHPGHKGGRPQTVK